MSLMAYDSTGSSSVFSLSPPSFILFPVLLSLIKGSLMFDSPVFLAFSTFSFSMSSHAFTAVVLIDQATVMPNTMIYTISPTAFPIKIPIKEPRDTAGNDSVTIS